VTIRYPSSCGRLWLSNNGVILRKAFNQSGYEMQLVSSYVQEVFKLSEGKGFVVGEVRTGKVYASSSQGAEKVLADRFTGTKSLVVGVYVCNAHSTLEMHYHKVEEFIYILYGTGVVRDLSGREYKIGPESTIYCAAGPDGAHEFENTDDVPMGFLFAHPAPEDPEMIPLMKK
jgi:mannose-6-phosphate isomerase-like protein (cupin superfamily)